MIRPVTFCTMLMAALSGAYLFGVKHRAQLLDDQLAAVTQGLRQDDQRITVLQAQWSLEIDHNRLQALTQQFSGLQAMKPSQLMTLAELAQKLPPAGSGAPEANPAAPPDVAPALVAAAPAAPVQLADAAATLPLPPPVAPAQTAPALSPALAQVVLASLRMAPSHKRPARQVAAMPAAKKSHFDGSELAETVALARPASLAPALPEGGKLLAANATADLGQGGSMLGMAADLAPPQPLTQGNSN